VLDLVGKPYQKGATGPDFYDCAGVVLAYLERLGHKVPADALSSPSAPCWELRGALGDVELEPGDVVLSLNEDGGLHVDVAVEGRDSRTLTAIYSHGTIIRRTYSIERALGVYRLK